jgi:hypothetical protein
MLNLFGVGADEEMKSTNEEPTIHKGDNITLLPHEAPQASSSDEKENRAKIDLDKNENTETKLYDVRLGEASTDIAIVKDVDLSIDVKPTGKIPYNFRDHHDDYAWKVYMLLFVYINTIIISLIYSGRYSYDPTVQSPWISKANATNILIKETKVMENEYQKVMQSNDWKILRSVPNVTIEIIEKDNEAMYIRIIAIHHLRPSALYEYFSWNNFDSTMKMVDPFYESSRLLFSPSTYFYTPSSAIQIAKKVKINSCRRIYYYCDIFCVTG